MIVRGAEGDGERGSPAPVDAGGEGGERRSGAGQRVRFEALVAVGETTGSGFEAESIDMSPEGMRLRTAYLPKVGDMLMCRFDGFGQEVVVEGEVCWRAEESRGGEFGLRFTGLDPAAEEAVRSMCASFTVAVPPAPAATKAAARGARVRLHIDGLGSPMKARVRGSSSEDLEVGSNLEFLKVGRSLGFEEVDQGTRREAYIDHVKVEIDPATSVPQLVVRLRYDAPPAARVRSRVTLPQGSLPPPSASAPSDGAVAKPSAPPAAPSRPRGGQAVAAVAEAGERDDQGDPDDHDDASPALQAHEPDAAGPASAGPASAGPASAGSEDEARDDDRDHDGEAQPGRLRGAGEKAAKAGRAVAARVGPALAGAGARAKGAMAGLVAKIQARRAAAAEGGGSGEGASKKAGPRRTTAPAPGGALKSEGRRLIREDAEVDDLEGADASSMKPGFNKKAAAMGSFLGLAAVLVIFGATRLLGLHGEAAAPATEGGEGAEVAGALPPASAAARLSAVAPVASAVAGGAPGGAVAAAAAGASAVVAGALTANVPLFGATPLSTIEPVPPTPPPPDPAAQVGDPAALHQMPGGPDAKADAGDEDPAGGGDSDSADARQWGQGTVRNPTVLKLKLDGPVEALNGAAGAMGFTVSLPDRRALSSGSGLARKDKRIASVRVVNTPHGAEVTVQFKDGVPAYLAKGRGDRLEIALGNDEPKKVASKTKKSKKAKGEQGSREKKPGKHKER